MGPHNSNFQFTLGKHISIEIFQKDQQQYQFEYPTFFKHRARFPMFNSNQANFLNLAKYHN